MDKIWKKELKKIFLHSKNSPEPEIPIDRMKGKWELNLFDDHIKSNN
jgi:hypothetical protein